MEIAGAMKEIYASSLQSFVKIRDQVARRLRDAGESEAAEQVAKVKKPTLPAWALSRLILTEPDRLEKVEAADVRLTEVMSKGKPDEVRAATHARHRTIGEVIDAAVQVLEEEGHKASPAVREKMAQTLYALSGDDDARNTLRSGLLSKELEPSGFGGMPDAATPAVRSASLERAERRATKLAEEATIAERQARDAEKGAVELERELETLTRNVERARKDAERKAAAAQRRKSEADEAARALAEEEGG